MAENFPSQTPAPAAQTPQPSQTPAQVRATRPAPAQTPSAPKYPCACGDNPKQVCSKCVLGKHPNATGRSGDSLHGLTKDGVEIIVAKFRPEKTKVASDAPKGAYAEDDEAEAREVEGEDGEVDSDALSNVGGDADVNDDAE